jgi:hypothetical protein
MRLIFDTTISILSVSFFSAFTAHKKMQIAKKNISNNKECCILGNGPSLAEVLIKGTEIFAGKHVFVVNNFCENNYFFKIQPDNYIIADPDYWKNDPNDLYMTKLKESFIEAFAKINWKMNFFVPCDIPESFISVFSSNKFLTITKYNRTPVKGYKKIAYFLYKYNLGMPLPFNVLNAAIFCALNLGFKNIYLYGADHSWIKDLFVDENNNVCSYQNHFYDKGTVRQSYIMPKESLVVGLECIVSAFKSYILLKKYAADLNSRVINKTKGSFIDVFDFE